MAVLKLIVDEVGEVPLACEGEGLFQSLFRLTRRRLPNACTNGGCGLCKMHILEGRVEMLGPMSRDHISETDERAGMVLGCRVTPRTSVRVRLVGKIRKFLVATA